MVTSEVETKTTVQKNNKTRQFLARTANQIFTSRELSAVEVCSNLLGYKNIYSSIDNWVNLHLNTLYWAVFRRWDRLGEAAGEHVGSRVAPETVGLGINGYRLSASDSYPHRGLLLRSLCFYEYLSMIRIRKLGKYTNTNTATCMPFEPSLPDNEVWIQQLVSKENQAVPVISGILNYNIEGTEDGFYKRYKQLLSNSIFRN